MVDFISVLHRSWSPCFGRCVFGSSWLCSGFIVVLAYFIYIILYCVFGLDASRVTLTLSFEFGFRAGRRPSLGPVFSSSTLSLFWIFGWISTVATRMRCEVAPPVDPTKRQNISRPSGTTRGSNSTAQAPATMLRKFRQRPQSESDEDSCFDPRTPSPPSSTNSADEDCAVDVVNLECAQPQASRIPAVPLLSQTNPNLHADEDDAIPSTQPRSDRPL